ncbi:uncharacterized protein AMSG_10408 [Thecamonas trahens ATCC 50062]|uniref:E3 ubiquitin-protein ligase TRIM37 n=1 Tax=Thecamonas trahens ATCC 50062 TaxID=461836 RepID=A0A0L0DSX7_THETB|nr:hypothetical protein AMSG_10408 [Thecamonas trahens ATCC 50062]KNC54558.1 hypothetical protein AMSG_10408 [Thecamonas trahens ATCC 50062]|eukprot:XP_013753573.1 hypothetical protein AMSG_10408 [Thecamonas trahens ATCC 50062]
MAGGDAAALSVLSNIEELFRCFICMARVEGAVMCPACSKMGCRACMSTWLVQRATCPHCRAPLQLDELVTCRFMNDLTDELDKAYLATASSSASAAMGLLASPPRGGGSRSPGGRRGVVGGGRVAEPCPAHPDQELGYYCETCGVAICSDCAMFGSTHTGHAFNKLDAVYAIHTSRIRVETNALSERLERLRAAIAGIDENIEEVTRAKEERMLEIRDAVDQMYARLEAELKTKLLALLAQKGSMAEELELISSVLGELERQLSAAPRSRLIAKTDELLGLLREMCQRPSLVAAVDDSEDAAESEAGSSALHVYVPPVFASEIVPEYASGDFVLASFSALRAAEDVVFSQPLVTHGLAWRLKVYPNGNGIARGTHLSVFLEMAGGLVGSARYEYRVEMRHSTAPSRPPVVREYTSEFEAGECWGYNKFFRLDALEAEGFARYITALESEAAQLRATLRSRALARQPPQVQAQQDAHPLLFDDVETLASSGSRSPAAAVLASAASSPGGIRSAGSSALWWERGDGDGVDADEDGGGAGAHAGPGTRSPPPPPLPPPPPPSLPSPATAPPLAPDSFSSSDDDEASLAQPPPVPTLPPVSAVATSAPPPVPQLPPSIFSAQPPRAARSLAPTLDMVDTGEGLEAQVCGDEGLHSRSSSPFSSSSTMSME